MGPSFKLEIFTPEREFFSGECSAVTVDASDGEITVLSGHAPMIATLNVGSIKYKKDGEWTEAVNSSGFMEVRTDRVTIFALTCERPEEIDINRAEEARHRAEEALRQKQSINDYKTTKYALARAMARLKGGKSGRFM